MEIDLERIIKEAYEGLEKLRDLAQKAEEWHNARMSVASMSTKEPDYMGCLNRLSEAEDSLSRVFTSP